MTRFAATFIVCALMLALAVMVAWPDGGVQARPHPRASAGPSPSPAGSPTPTPEERIKTLSQTVKDNPNDKLAQAELGQLLVITGNPRDGRDHLEQAIHLGFDDAQVWFYIGVADNELSDPQDAVSALQRAEDLDPANQAVLSNLVDTLLRVGRVDDALHVANRAVQLHPTDAFAYESLGLVQLSRGKFDEGRKSLAKALTIDPKDYRSQALIGRSYLSQPKPDADKALEQYNAILAADPKNVDAIAGKAEALARKNDVPGAVAMLQQLVKLEPDSVEPEDDIAQLYLDKKMFDQARQAFAQAAKDHPKAAEPFALQAEYDVRQKNYAQAEKEFESALALSASNLSLLFDYGRLELLVLKHYTKAQDAFSKVANAQPNNPEALLWMGQTYAAEGQWLQARDEYRASFNISHTYTGLFNLGLAEFNLHNYKQARQIFLALSVHQLKDHPDAQLWFMLGETERHLGNKHAATAAYKRFLAYAPNGGGADKARGYIKQLQQ
ncbi:MAG: tetratricopeptide repeat protein [Candidatus Eremiobacteraeota bacterium]|nr:tetratricopeptide repeat protein [Candidatus Eremiobacteraeota bacterium]